MNRGGKMMHIAIIGCGNMGTALAKLLSPFHCTHLFDRNREWTQELSKKTNGKACQNLQEAIEEAQIIFLAVKPQNLQEIAPIIEPHLNKEQILISLLAGTPLSVLQEAFSKSMNIRIMPNLAMQHGKGIIGIVNSINISPDLKVTLEEILAPLGFLYWLKESQIDALTSLASSGPAFILTLIEAMIESGIAMGFQAKDAELLTLHMMQGCLTMIQETEKHPAELKWKIASPNGTTIAGLRVLEKENVRSGLMETFLAAYHRAQELSRNHVIPKKQ